ncbi:MAG: PEP/pyruvate-binding domain-containing protein [Myxococcaceae bacterium]
MMTANNKYVFSSLLLSALLACGAPSSSSEDGPVGGHDRPLNVAPSPFWRAQLGVPEDDFYVAGGGDQPRWVKLSIDVADPTRVYFQDGREYAFHYHFARKHFSGYGQMTAEQFAQVTLKAQGQKLHLGAVLLPAVLSSPHQPPAELGIQLVRHDAYTQEEVRALVELVRSKLVITGPQPKLFYMPTFEQTEAAEASRAYLESHGIGVSSVQRWVAQDVCYSNGWAVGALKFFKGGEIAQAYLDGKLTQDDILLTDSVPSEVPYVAGILALQPATPNSHVAILSRTWNIPFAYPSREAERARILALAGKDVALRSKADYVGCTLDVIAPAAPLDAATKAALKTLRAPPKAQVPARTHLGVLTRAAVDLKPTDARYFGGKASNFGSLRRSIPNESPRALGVSFDLWDAFVSQKLPSGLTLQQEIDARLAGFSFPANPLLLEPKLAEIRTLVSDASIPPQQAQKLLSELTAFGFDPKVKLRFRSSTNVEDGTVLSGAGLYASYSGCLADDLDADSVGPSACDAQEANERGALRAVKRTFGSFFNTNAVLERIKYQIPESAVGMALAVHPSLPDVFEAANGVATVTFSESFGLTEMRLVTQKGAVSVTNPEGGAIPEEMNVFVFGSNVSLTFQRASSLVPLGEKVMTWEADYEALARLLQKAGKEFIKDLGVGAGKVVLDFEYKKTTDGRLEVKQVRTVPQPSSTQDITPILVSQERRFCTLGHELDDVMAVHRLKASLSATTRWVELTSAELAAPLFADTSLDMLEALTPVQRAGPMATYPSASHVVEADALRDSWKGSDGTYSLRSAFPRKVSAADLPLLFPRDFTLRMEASYAAPVPSLRDRFTGPVTTTKDSVLLLPCLTEAEIAPQVQTAEATGKQGLVVKTQYRYRLPLTGFDKTAVLGRFLQTEITGLTSSPILLKSERSQTFVPRHHNFAEDFIFDPELEPGLAESVKAQLRAKDIRLLVVQKGFTEEKIYVLRRSTGKLELW